jgi:hypothetical protein
LALQHNPSSLHAVPEGAQQKKDTSVASTA